MTKQNHNGRKLSLWQIIFLWSKANGAPYYGETLSRHHWEWPKETYLQRRLRYVKEPQLSPIHSPNLSPEDRFERFYKKLLQVYRSNSAKILPLRFGVGESHDHTLDELGTQFSITRERVRQIEAKTLRKLRFPRRKLADESRTASGLTDA